jgi:hypothetical protein
MSVARRCEIKNQTQRCVVFCRGSSWRCLCCLWLKNCEGRAFHAFRIAFHLVQFLRETEVENPWIH